MADIFGGCTAGSAEGYFLSNLESMTKDVECTFGIMKKRWKILNNGLLYGDIKVHKKIFITCACLHNLLVKDMKMNHLDTRVGRGAPLGKDVIYLDGRTIPPNVDKSKLHLAEEFGKQRNALATHLRVHLIHLVKLTDEI